MAARRRIASLIPLSALAVGASESRRRHPSVVATQSSPGGPSRKQVETTRAQKAYESECFCLQAGQLRRTFTNLRPRVTDELEEAWWDVEGGGDRAVTGVRHPNLAIFLPEPGDGPAPAVIICPGGGYERIAIEKEGLEIAAWLADRGVAAAVLKYRLPPPGEGSELALQEALSDVRDALRFMRSRTNAWKLDAERVGVLGISAGGHLAACSSVRGGPDAPAFTALLYPVISMMDPVTHKASRLNMLGADAWPELLRRASPEQHVRSGAPPAFLAHAGDDEAVIPENSILYYQALRAAGVPCEMHLFARGEGHGGGLRKPHLPFGAWPELLIAWLRNVKPVVREH